MERVPTPRPLDGVGAEIYRNPYVQSLTVPRASTSRQVFDHSRHAQTERGPPKRNPWKNTFQRDLEKTVNQFRRDRQQNWALRSPQL